MESKRKRKTITGGGKVNYTEFMDRVEKQVKSMSKEDLGKWIFKLLKSGIFRET